MTCPKCHSACARIFKPAKGWRCIVCWIWYPEPHKEPDHA